MAKEKNKEQSFNTPKVLFLGVASFLFILTIGAVAYYAGLNSKTAEEAEEDGIMTLEITDNDVKYAQENSSLSGKVVSVTSSEITILVDKETKKFVVTENTTVTKGLSSDEATTAELTKDKVVSVAYKGENEATNIWFEK